MLIGKSFRIIVQFRFNSFQCQRFRFSSSLKILFFGTDNFSLPSLKRLSHEKLSRLEVVTSFKALNNPIKSFAENNDVKVHDWAMLSKNTNFHLCRQFDLGLVVSFGHLIPEEIINCFQSGMLNVHASLLPKYRGASPIIYAMRNGDKETGVSIMRIRPKKFDVGEILAIQRVAISDDMMMPELHEKLATTGADLLVDCIKDINRNQPVEQDHKHASYAPKISKEFCKARWNEMSSEEVFNLYRSIYSFKNITTSFKGEPVKLYEVARSLNFQPDILNSQPGQAVFCRVLKKLFVKCADENYVEIKQLSIGRKKAMSAISFNNGFLSKCDELERIFK